MIVTMGLDGIRAPFAFPGDLVVFDNLSAHLRPDVAEAVECAEANVLPLPPYSPDFNPIEEMFSKFKEALR